MDEKKSQLDTYLENLGISDDVPVPSTESAEEPAPSVSVQAKKVPIPQTTLSQTELSDADGPESMAKSFLLGLLAHFGQGFIVQIHSSEDTISVDISGGDVGRIIGREGRTLGAIEFLTNAILVRHIPQMQQRVSVDAAGYKRRHEERLISNARRIAARVHKSGEAVALEPMSPADRRIVHMTLREDALVTTESIGEGAERYIVIKPRA